MPRKEIEVSARKTPDIIIITIADACVTIVKVSNAHEVFTCPTNSLF